MKRFLQYPEPGRHLLRYCGDTITIRITGEDSLKDGKAFLSTNIGNAAIRRSEIIQEVEERITAGGSDWIDLPMERIDDFTFALKLSLTEPGHFECKCSFVPADGSEPTWAQGDNIHVNVEPAFYCCSNSIYCAFVRQFGSNKGLAVSAYPAGITRDEMKKYDDNGFSLIPGSGTFRDLIRELDHIINHLKCRIVHLLPINPTPTTYGRMGRFGSPYASLDFTGINPELAEFDRKATPLDQFIELASAIHQHDGKLFIDIAINHTGWAAKLHETNPDWLVRNPDGSIHSPGAWGVTWGDLTELDHTKLELWKYLADMFLVWCRRGVDGFRCDAGYMIPIPAWEYITARVRQEFPDTVFLLEGLGGDPAVTRRLLDEANMDWAYSELFQNYTRQQIEGYLKYAWGESSSDGIMVHYAETHDNNRLAATSTAYASMRTALSALTSVSGAFGFANGVEWFATEKIDVHEASALNWGSAINQNALIKRLNLLLALHPAFHNGAMLSFADSGSPDAILVSRTDSDNTHGVLIAVNLNCSNASRLEFSSSSTPFPEGVESVIDLITGKKISLVHLPGGKLSLHLPAAKFTCLSSERVWLDKLAAAETDPNLSIDHLTLQEAKATLLKLLAYKNKTCILPMEGFDEDEEAQFLLHSPEEFLKALNEYAPCNKVILWQWPQDLHREVMIPPGNIFLPVAPYRFRCTVLIDGHVVVQTTAVKDDNGRYFAIIPPLPNEPGCGRTATLQIRVYPEGKASVSSEASLLLLPDDVSTASIAFDRAAIYNRNRIFLQANGCGAIIHQRMELEKLESRYDAILLANLDPEIPVDRHIMWRRIRVWIVWRARRQELKHEHLHSFHVAADGGGVWDYLVPVGNGLFVKLCIKMMIVQDKNAVFVTVFRHPCDAPKRLADDVPIRVIVRPDIEDRNFHTTTKAGQGPEHYWPSCIVENPRGFEFRAASTRILSIQASKGSFTRKDEWLYAIHHINEEQRGLDPMSDLFSPGAFKVWLSGNENVMFAGNILTDAGQKKAIPETFVFDPFQYASSDIEKAALHSLSAFVVKRNELKTVIAGYPWFLDWGRDTLIAARGLIAAGDFREDVRDILLQFAKFEKDGTIPNMISGSNASNRDTSDAPLWLFTAAADLCRAEGNNDFLNTIVRDGQTFRDVLEKLAAGIIRGTPNGIVCDPESMLVFSPPHFTWMDTNYPAGTPREGYPIEIQSLWFAALSFLAKISADPARAEDWRQKAEMVQKSILRFFKLKNQPYLSDCLHCKPGTPAAQAVADDHLRPNQLLAITLGAVKDRTLRTNILKSAENLLIPGAIRSLADMDTEYALPVYGADGRLLNNPHHPYFGKYEGDEDTRRKPAYHNGTAWTWQFPSFVEAYYMTYGEFGKATAKSYLSSMIIRMDDGCIMQLPEIIDGDYPHRQRGCDAQAWGMTEFYRIWKMLH